MLNHSLKPPLPRRLSSPQQKAPQRIGEHPEILEPTWVCLNDLKVGSTKQQDHEVGSIGFWFVIMMACGFQFHMFRQDFADRKYFSDLFKKHGRQDNGAK